MRRRSMELGFGRRCVWKFLDLGKARVAHSAHYALIMEFFFFEDALIMELMNSF
jgi:hypothetical protein